MTATEPPIRRQLVGGALRHYREGFGATLADAAEVLGCGVSKVCRIEAGERGIRPDELRLLLAEYGVDDEDVRDALVTMAGPYGTAGWWSGHGLPGAAREYLELEALSAQACYYAPLRVPEPMQAPACAESLHGATTGQPSLAVEAALARQARLLDGTRVVQVVLSEAVLHQAPGRPAVMRQQLAHLAALGESAQVVLQVVPFSAFIHTAPDLGALTILRFGRAPAGISLACLPGTATGQFLTGTGASFYVRAWEQLRACALSLDESVALLRQRAAA